MERLHPPRGGTTHVPTTRTVRQVHDIHTEAETIRETIANKYDIIRDDISHNKILSEPAKVKLKDTKIIPYRVSTTRQIPIQYQG